MLEFGCHANEAGRGRGAVGGFGMTVHMIVTFSVWVMMTGLSCAEVMTRAAKGLASVYLSLYFSSVIVILLVVLLLRDCG